MVDAIGVVEDCCVIIGFVTVGCKVFTSIDLVAVMVQLPTLEVTITV